MTTASLLGVAASARPIECSRGTCLAAKLGYGSSPLLSSYRLGVEDLWEILG
jgi:hypothetical protein